MKKNHLTLQHQFVSYMLISTAIVLLSAFLFSFWFQRGITSVVMPAETVLVDRIEMATVTPNAIDATMTSPAVVTAQVFEAQPTDTTPALSVRAIAVEGIGEIKNDIVIASQRQYMLLIALVLVIQFIGSMIWVKKVLVKPLHKSIEKIDTLAQANYSLQPCTDGPHELDHLNHQLYVLSTELEQNKLERESETRRRKALIAGISHDLKTPLTNISGYTETLLMDESRSQQKDWLQVVLRNAELANRLIGDLLEMNRYDHEQYAVNLTPVNIDELIKTCIEDINPHLLESKQEIVTQVAGVIVETDEVLIMRLVKNILSNFNQHAGDGTQLMISASQTVTETETGLNLVFEDNGVGLSKDKIPFATDIFYVGNPARSTTGNNGLGLYNCKQIVDLLGGHLEIESDEGKGMRLSISVPKRLG